MIIIYSAFICVSSRNQQTSWESLHDHGLTIKKRTVGNKTPLQLFIMGIQRIRGENRIVASEYFEFLGEVHNLCAFVVPPLIPPLFV